ncbi:MAG: hypothetical protein WA144_09315 [Candidatus Methanoperedens sp.]
MTETKKKMIREKPERITEEPDTEATIIKEPVIGFIVSAAEREDGSKFLWVTPVSLNWEGLLNDEDLDALVSKASVLGVLPAPAESFKVFGSDEDITELKPLGFEFKGCYHPEWTKELKEKLHLD